MEKHTVQVFNREVTLRDDANNGCNAIKPSNVMLSYLRITHLCVILPHEFSCNQFCKWIEGRVGGRGGYCKSKESSSKIQHSLQTGSWRGQKKKKSAQIGILCQPLTIKLCTNRFHFIHRLLNVSRKFWRPHLEIMRLLKSWALCTAHQQI